MSGGIYVHIPFCKAKCAYCSFVSITDLSQQKRYVAALLDEIKLRAGFTADTIYIGGGTPSTLYRGAIREIIETVYCYNSIAENAEITVEANPESATEAFFDECLSAKVNRISFGLQAMSDILLHKIGRIHTVEQFLQAYEQAKTAKMRINVDLMLGIPGQTDKDALDAVQTVGALDPGHISVYALTVEEDTPLCRSGFTVDEDEQATFYDACYHYLDKLGYKRYEVSNFARKGQESRHNQKYWAMEPYLGLGAAAHSFDGRVRRANTENVSAYIADRNNFTEIRETDDELREEFIMLSLRTTAGLNLIQYNELFGRDLYVEKMDAINRLIQSNLLVKETDHLHLTDNAFYIMNRIIVDLL